MNMFLFLLVGPVFGSGKFNVCQSERCFRCTFVLGSSNPGHFRFRDICGQLLRHANCCQRFTSHTGALVYHGTMVPAKQPDTLPLPDDSCLEFDAKFAVMILSGVTVMAMAFIIVKKIPKVRSREILNQFGQSSNHNAKIVKKKILQ